MRTMYDSVTAADIPATAKMVAGYLAPSRYRWTNADWARFPNARKVRIAIFASVNDGHVLDVEPGDATPAEAPGWVMMRRRAGLAEPTIYCNLSTWPQVRREFDQRNIRQPQYWIARYDGVPEVYRGSVAKQYANPPTSGGHWDLSAVADYWPGVDPLVQRPIPKPEVDMGVVPIICVDVNGQRGRGVNAHFVVYPGFCTWISNEEALANLRTQWTQAGIELETEPHENTDWFGPELGG